VAEMSSVEPQRETTISGRFALSIVAQALLDVDPIVIAQVGSRLMQANRPLPQPKSISDMPSREPA
jgi:hypothetical protein